MNTKKNQQFNFKNNSSIFNFYLKQCNKLIVCNFFLSLGFFFLLFKIIEFLTITKHVPLWLVDLAGDDNFRIISSIIFSVFLLFCSLVYIFRLRCKAMNTLSKGNLNFFIWIFYFALIPIFGSIYLFLWSMVMKKKYLIKTKYSSYYSLFSLLIINMLVIIAYWMIYMIKGGISYTNVGNQLSSGPTHFGIPTIFDLFILPIKAIIGWVKIFRIQPAFSEMSMHSYTFHNDGTILCILLLLLVSCYSLVASTSTFDAIINNLILKTQGETTRIIALPMIIVCLLSHFLGMYHEIIIFYPIYGKFLLLFGFDLLTVFYVFFFPITIGYGTSLFNPLIVNVLKIEINPWLQMGVHIQFLLLAILLTITISFVLNYAKKTLNNLPHSVVYDTTMETKKSSDFLQKNLVLTEKKIKNFCWFIFVFLLLLLTNHNWLDYWSDLSFDISFVKLFLFWLVPSFPFPSRGKNYELDDMPLIDHQKYLFLRTNYWIILFYCFFFIIFNYKEISWQNFSKNFKNFIPFIIATILCKAIEINFSEFGAFNLISRKSIEFISNETFELKTIIFVFLIFISLILIRNPLLGSGGILLEMINPILIVKATGYATYYHAFLSSIIIVNLLSPVSLLNPFLIHHKISYSTYIKSSWKLILPLILVIFSFVCGHKYLLK